MDDAGSEVDQRGRREATTLEEIVEKLLDVFIPETGPDADARSMS